MITKLDIRKWDISDLITWKWYHCLIFDLFAGNCVLQIDHVSEAQQTWIEASGIGLYYYLCVQRGCHTIGFWGDLRKTKYCVWCLEWGWGQFWLGNLLHVCCCMSLAWCDPTVKIGGKLKVLTTNKSLYRYLLSSTAKKWQYTLTTVLLFSDSKGLNVKKIFSRHKLISARRILCLLITLFCFLQSCIHKNLLDYSKLVYVPILEDYAENNPQCLLICTNPRSIITHAYCWLKTLMQIWFHTAVSAVLMVS